MSKFRRRADIAFLVLGIAALLLALFGCGDSRAAVHTDDSARVAQAVANSQAGLDAFAKAPGVSFDAGAAKILEGAKEYDLAAAGKSVLPPPTMDTGAILSNPDAYHAGAVSARQHADGTWLKILAAGGLSLVISAAVAAASFVPALAPFAGPVAKILGNVHWFAVGSKQEREADASARELAGHAKTVVDGIAPFLPTFEGSLPPAARAAIDAILAKSKLS